MMQDKMHLRRQLLQARKCLVKLDTTVKDEPTVVMLQLLWLPAGRAASLTTLSELSCKR